MSDEEGRPELRPARPDAAGLEGRPSYMPRMPWRWVLLGAAVLVAMFGGYYLRRQQRGDALRQEMLTLHEERLSEVASRYLGFRNRLETLIYEAAQAEELETWVDPRLNLEGLRAGEGLYLRLRIEPARDREQIPRAARGMNPDAIMRCLGIPAMNVRGLYDSGDFLTPDWVEELRNEQDMMRLRVLEDQLGRHVQVDTHVVVDMMQADWFLLVLQHGDSRREHPVDVYLWDLRRDRQLMRARIQARGLLVPVRLQFEGQGPSQAASQADPTAGGANDCSIASQIRALVGGRVIDFESAGTLLEAPSDASDGDAAPPAEGVTPDDDAESGEPPTVEPPTVEPPTVEPPTVEPPADPSGAD